MHVIADHANFQEIAFEIGYLLGQENRPESLTLTEEMNPSMPIHHDNHDEDDSNKTTVFRSPLLEKKAPPKKASESTGAPLYVAISMKYFLGLPEMKLGFNLYSRVKKEETYEYNVKVLGENLLTRAEIDRMVLRE